MSQLRGPTIETLGVEEETARDIVLSLADEYLFFTHICKSGEEVVRDESS